jgi:tryptophan synthase alpha chain
VTGAFEAALRSARSADRKVIVPYITGGLGDDWLDAVRAAVDAGADAVEIGIPFSDPVMDGPTIQAAGDRALRAGTTPVSIFAQLRHADVGVPLAVMTYYNIVHHMGLERFASTAVDSGVAGAILPDVPLEESEPWCEVADRVGIETIMLAAPTADAERLARIVARARGFVYAVGLLGVTGVRDRLAASSLEIAGRLKAITDKPVLVGVGVSTPAQAAEVCTVADGVVIGSAVVQRLLDGEGPTGVGEFIGAVRDALDA